MDVGVLVFKEMDGRDIGDYIIWLDGCIKVDRVNGKQSIFPCT